MDTTLERSELFEDLDASYLPRLIAIAQRRPLAAGEYLFALGDAANELYVVLSGRIDICFPFSFEGELKDIAVESKAPGSALGWSAFVRPYRFTLSARAAEPSEVAAFAREELEELLRADCRLGLEFTHHIAEMVGARLLRIQALWARELQRSLPRGGSIRASKTSDTTRATGKAQP